MDERTDSAPVNRRARLRIRVGGIVQGVGFRPFVHNLARRLALSGFVRNDSRGVLIEVEGIQHQVRDFIDSLRSEAPPLALIEHLESAAGALVGESQFKIIESEAAGAPEVLIAPDIATCEDCVREIFAPDDRRYRYPFNNCTNCGPRFTIVTRVPYDRALTTMARFTMCSECAREYGDPSNRRFHAQPVSCPRCGPILRLVDRIGDPIAGDPVRAAADCLRDGQILAVKGLGGFHLAADATNETAVVRLRARKYRESKPFAVMVPDIFAARELAEIDQAEAQTISSSRRPIVLLRRLAEAKLASAVAPGNRNIGLMLPYTPVHHLLCGELARPFVLTSGNVSDEPIAYLDSDAAERLNAIADCFLIHDRAIHLRTDDSVVRVLRGREYPIRRSRGYAPQPLAMPFSARRPILACGAELKNTFCLVKGDRAFVSHHIGDLENYETLSAFTDGIAHFRRLFGIDPQLVAHDLHPEYLSTKYAMELNGVELIGVQHHHAHIASCLADNGQQGPAIGVALDGLGYGIDSTFWGGEFLVANLERFQRVGHFEAVAMPGGVAAIRQPWRMAAAYLDALFGDSVPEGLEVIRRNSARWRKVVRMARAQINSPRTSSVGRLFDAVAAIIGVRDTIDYEGQAAIELEQHATTSEESFYKININPDEMLLARGTELVRAVVGDLRANVPTGIIAARFHNTLARMIADICRIIRSRRGHNTVALSGGVFQNMLLLDRTERALGEQDFRVHTHHQVPANDGGISFGQAAIAAARDSH
ncbi:MAG: carbamoyltransferase HypF [Candidatus Binataceae bacterium]